jgi:murein DD-endopeptidase MepM/ murein hydrolase activator NlpD
MTFTGTDRGTLSRIEAAIAGIAVDQQARIDAAVADQKAADDLVLAGVQESLREALEQKAAAEAALILDDQKVADLTQTVSDLRQQLADCEAEHEDPPPTETLWGANTGGYRVTMGETAPNAYARIKAGFGRLNVVRWWVNGIPNWGAYPSYFDKGIAVAPEINGSIATFNTGAWNQQIIDFCIQATVPTFLVGWHEPEKDVFTAGAYTVADWQAAQHRS